MCRLEPLVSCRNGQVWLSMEVDEGPRLWDFKIIGGVTEDDNCS